MISSSGGEKREGGNWRLKKRAAAMGSDPC
jgi:hypothetical protein